MEKPVWTPDHRIHAIQLLHKIFVLKKGGKKDYIDYVESFSLVPEAYSSYVEDFRKSGDISNWFVTLNWKPDVNLSDVKIRINKVLKKKWISEYYYTFEQRGESEEECGKGIHTHMLLIDTGKTIPAQVKREIYSSVKSYVGNINHVDVRKVEKDWIEDKLQYMSGEKWDEGKDLKCKIDVLFRQRNNLKEMYSSKRDPGPTSPDPCYQGEMGTPA